MSEINSNGKALTGGDLLAKNSLFNLIGQGVPLVAAIIAIPLLIRGLGIDRFGVLTLTWMVIGYFSLFDLGLGRALTLFVSSKRGTSDEEDIPALVWTSLGIMFALGLIGALALSLSSYWLINSVLKIPDNLKTEALSSFLVLSVGIPVVIGTSGLVALLSSFQRFDILNKIKIPMGIYSFLAPLLVLPFSNSLYPITAVLVFGRLISFGIHFAACISVLPRLRTEFKLKFSVIKPLFRIGAWMTVSNIVSPLMVYLDRFAISGLISIAAVSFYATPYEIITKLWIIPSAIVTVLFPAFAENHKRNPDGTLTLLIVGTKYIALILFPLVLLVATFANELLSLWLGHEFASKSTSVLQWLSIGVYLNCIAMMFFTYIQAIGRPDLSAKLHIIELPFYLLLLWWAIQYFGMLGAAIVWTIRVTLDGSVLIVLLSYQNAKFSARLKSTMKYIVISTMALCFPLVLGAFTQRLLLTTLILSIYSYLTWFELLDKEEKYFIKLKLAGLFVKRKSLAD